MALALSPLATTEKLRCMLMGGDNMFEGWDYLIINPVGYLFIVNIGLTDFFFLADLALMSYECEAPETQFEKERRKSLR